MLQTPWDPGFKAARHNRHKWPIVAVVMGRIFFRGFLFRPQVLYRYTFASGAWEIKTPRPVSRRRLVRWRGRDREWRRFTGRAGSSRERSRDDPNPSNPFRTGQPTPQRPGADPAQPDRSAAAHGATLPFQRRR